MDPKENDPGRISKQPVSSDIVARAVLGQIIKDNPELLGSQLSRDGDGSIVIKLDIHNKSVTVKDPPTTELTEGGEVRFNPTVCRWTRALSAALLLGKALKDGDQIEIDARSQKGTIKSDDWHQAELSLVSIGVAFSSIDTRAVPQVVEFKLDSQHDYLFPLQATIADTKSSTIDKRRAFPSEQIEKRARELGYRIPNNELEELNRLEIESRERDIFFRSKDISQIAERVTLSGYHDEDRSPSESIPYDSEAPAAIHMNSWPDSVKVLIWSPSSHNVALVESNLPTEYLRFDSKVLCARITDQIKQTFDPSERPALRAVISLGELKKTDLTKLYLDLMVNDLMLKGLEGTELTNNENPSQTRVFSALTHMLEKAIRNQGVDGEIVMVGGADDSPANIVFLNSHGGIILEEVTKLTDMD